MSNNVVNTATSTAKTAPVPSTRKTVGKAMQILHSFSNAEPELSVGVLSERLGMHKSVVSRLVSSLCEWQMLERDPATRRLRLGLGAFKLGMLVASQTPLNRLARPLLSALVERTRQTAHVSVLDNGEMLVIASVQSPEVLRVSLRTGDRRPLNATAAGKLFLAWMAPERAAAWMAESGLPALTPATIADRARLERELEAVRCGRIAWNEAESAAGVGGVAAPVFDGDGRMVAAASLVYPLSLAERSCRIAFADGVRRTAAELTSALSGER